MDWRSREFTTGVTGGFLLAVLHGVVFCLQPPVKIDLDFTRMTEPSPYITGVWGWQVTPEGLTVPENVESLLTIGLDKSLFEDSGGEVLCHTTLDDRGRPAGILAQRTNIGRYDRDQFAMVPELGVTLGYRVSPRLRFTLGYTLVYFSNVVRVGDQVDLDVNPNLFPPEADPFSGPLRPAFVYRETDFWAQGLSFGGDLRW